MQRAISSVARAARLLLELGEHPEGLGVSEIGRRLGYHKSAAFRLLKTLVAYELAQQDSRTKKYSIGPAVLRLATRWLGARGIERRLRPFMERLRDRCGHSVVLAVRDGPTVLYTAIVEGFKRVKVTVDVGVRLPLHAAAAGKVFLADLTPEEVRDLLKGRRLARLTPKTVHTFSRLREEIRRVRAVGYATNNEEADAGLCALAAPVRNATGEVIATLGITYPAHTISRTEQADLTKVLVETADEATTHLAGTLRPPSREPR